MTVLEAPACNLISTMLGGDETGAVVIDVGTHSTKVGHAGEDTPRELPSFVGIGSGAGDTSERGQSMKYQIGLESLLHRKDGVEVVSPFEDGIVSNWEAMEQLMLYSINRVLRVPSSEHPLIVTEPAFNTNACREKMMELCFEKINCPAFFLAKTPVLAGFAAGRATGLMVESGGGFTVAAPVYDGYLLKQGLVTSKLAGDRLTKEMGTLLAEQNAVIHPHFELQKSKSDEAPVIPTPVVEYPGTTSSFRALHVNRVLQDIKESHCRVAELPWAHGDEVTATIKHELPDRSQVEIGPQIFSIPEIIFNPRLLRDQEEAAQYKGVQEMIHDSINACDVDIRKELFQGILLSGGNTIFYGYVGRLNKELSVLCPSQKVKVLVSNHTVERKFGPWIGGSILGSLGSFNKMWVSKAEYEESGSVVVEQKCP